MEVHDISQLTLLNKWNGMMWVSKVSDDTIVGH